MSLHGKIALVTGSTSGLGAEIARQLAAVGCTIALNGLGPRDEIETQRAHLETTFNIKATHFPADLTQPAQIAELISAITTQLGPIDILVNNAGSQFVSPLESFPPEKWDHIIALNLTAAFHTTRAVLPEMKRRRWGRIVNIASAHGLVASPFKSAYVASKHGLVGLTKVTALETARDGITCNAVCPGYINTALVERQIEKEIQSSAQPREKVIEDLFLSRHPTGEFVRAEDVAALIIFLCTESGQSITGAALPIDGGWIAR